ncbi:MAG: transglutaminase domain-containing protein, partial [Chitinophagales bacterium]
MKHLVPPKLVQLRHVFQSFSIWIGLFVLGSFLFSNSSAAQTANYFADYDFSKIDAAAKRIPKTIPLTPKRITQYLASLGTNDLEKVRAFYVWLTNNVQYDMAALKQDKRINQTNQHILERGKAVCWGYATFFKTMCDQVGISAAIISGYSKGTVTETYDLSEVDHAWSGVKINGEWHLLDATWGAAYVVNHNNFIPSYNDDYFLPPASRFLLKHLPADPVWQLLDCPISPNDFQLSDDYILALAQSSTTCYALQDSLTAWEQRPHELQTLYSAFNAYRFHPIPHNKEQVGHKLMDYEFYLSQQAEQLRGKEEQIDVLLATQQKIIDNALIAQQYINLYNHHKENLGYTYLNYATTLSRKAIPLENQGDYQGILAIYDRMYSYLQTGKGILLRLPSNFHIQTALAQCEDTLEVIAHNRS